MQQRCGTIGYLAPELLKNGERNIEITPAIDMWALGVILYELCVAYSPLRLKTFKYGAPVPFDKRDWKRFDDEKIGIRDLI